MNLFQEKLTSFQEKISTYDKANWEIIVEKYKSKTSIFNVTNTKGVHHQRQLIDLDLFRGKKFSKAKPVYHWTYVTFKATLRVFLYPFYYKWWIDHLDYHAYFVFLFVYMLEALMVLLYSFNNNIKQHLTFIQTFSAIIITLYVGQLYNHVISTNLTKPGDLCAKPKPEVKSMYARSISTDNIPVSDKMKPVITLKVRKRTCAKSIFLDTDYHGESDCSGGGARRLKSLTGSREGPDVEHFSSEQTSSIGNPDCADIIDNESADHISHSSSSLSDSNEAEGEFTEIAPKPEIINNSIENSTKNHIKGEVVVTLFEKDGIKKFKMSIYDIIQTINDRVNTCMLEYKYFWIIFAFCIYFSCLPLLFELFRLCIDKYLKSGNFNGLDLFNIPLAWFTSTPYIVLLQMTFILVTRFCVIGSFMFLLCVTERTFRVRYLYAKYFAALTSYRRARRNHLPHFRLSKVRNIRAWLTLRSYLRRNSPMRSIDVVVSSTFFISIVLITIVCSQLLLATSVTDISNVGFMNKYTNWEIPSWAILFSTYLLRFMSLGAEVNRKYDNHSELLTEQINLYLQMEITPHKKDEYVIANNVLKLASKLLKGIEAPYKITGFIMNPLLRNITRVVILSLVSGVVSEILGIKFKFWKIKA